MFVYNLMLPFHKIWGITEEFSGKISIFCLSSSTRTPDAPSKLPRNISSAAGGGTLD